MGSKKTQHKKEQRRRQKLRARQDLAARRAWLTEHGRDPDAELDRALAERHHPVLLPVDVDDRGFRPAYVDPLLRGPARVTGETAAAVKRGRTVPKWEYDERTGGQP